MAHWVRDAERLVSIDISTPPKKLGSTWTFDDLELDPYVTRNGIFGVEDEDEFDAALVDGFIDEPEARCARHAVDWFRREPTGGSSPFVDAGLRRLAQAVKNGLPPLHYEDTTHFLP